MIHFLLAVHDRQLNAYLRVFPVPSKGAGIRSFRDITNDVKSDVNKHPEDYTLFHVGNFNDETGAVAGLASPEQLAIATNLIERV